MDLSHSKPYRMPENRFFGNIAAVLPARDGGERPGGGRTGSQCLHGWNAMEIAGEPGHRHALIGTVETYRVHGGRAYEMNNLGPPVAGNENTPNLLVGQMPRCRLGLLWRCRRQRNGGLGGWREAHPPDGCRPSQPTTSMTSCCT